MQTRSLLSLLSVLVLLSSPGTHAGVELYQVHSDSNVTLLKSYQAINAQFHKPRHEFFNISGYLVWSKPGRACSAIEETGEKTGDTPVAGNIVFMESGNCYPETKAKHAQQLNASGAIIESYRIGIGLLPFMWNGKSNDDLNIRTLEVGRQFTSDLKKFLADLPANDKLFVVIFPDPNSWEAWLDVDPLWITVCVVFGTLAVVRVVIAAERWHHLRKFDSSTRKTAETAMILQLIASVLSFCFCLGPVQTVGILNFGAQTVFFTINLPFMTDINILIAYYWHRALTGKSLGMKIASLERYKKIAIGYAITCHLLEFASAGTRAALIDVGFITTLSGIFYVLAFTITLTYFAYTSFLLLRFLSQIEAKKNRRIRRMMYMIILNCTGSLTLVLVAILVASPLFQRPGPYAILRIFRCVGVELVGFSQIFIFTRYSSSQPNSGELSDAARNNSSERSMSRQGSHKRHNYSNESADSDDVKPVVFSNSNDSSTTEMEQVQVQESLQSQQSITMESPLPQL